MCKAHYHALYNELQPTQTHCVTCGSDLRKSDARVCPDPQIIQKYLAEHTGFDGQIRNGAKVCHPCYKTHLGILKAGEKESTDISLQAVIQKLQTDVVPIEAVNTVEGAVNRAVITTSIYVGNCLLRQKAVLLLSYLLFMNTSLHK